MHKIKFTEAAKVEVIESFVSRRVPLTLAETALEKIVKFGLDNLPINLTDDVYFYGQISENHQNELEIEIRIERDLFSPHHCCPPVYHWVKVRTVLVRSQDDSKVFDLLEKAVVTSTDGGPWRAGHYGVVGLFRRDHPRFIERTAELTALCQQDDGGGGGGGRSRPERMKP